MTKQLTLTKADLIQEVERITELKRSESEAIVETIFDSIIESLQKGEKIEIPPKKIPFFKPSKELKDFVNSAEAAASAGSPAAGDA
jgi:integration host factor subunit beta